MLMYNLLPDDFEDYGIPEAVGSTPIGGLVLDAIIQPHNEATREIVAAALRYCGSSDEGLHAIAEQLADLALGAFRERLGQNWVPEFVGLPYGYALIGTTPCQGRGENPLLMSALEESLRKRRIAPVYAVFDGEGGVFKGFVSRASFV